MGRSILATVAGYVVMTGVIMASLALTVGGLGKDFMFEPDSLEPKASWMALNVVLSLVAAVLGGFVAALVARRADRKPVKVLAGILLVLGLGMAIARVMQPPPDTAILEEARAEGRELSAFELASEAKQPVWYAFLLPFLGAGGVLLGGRMWTPTGDVDSLD